MSNKIEEGELIEDPLYHMDHAEKFLLATESRISGEIELICGNGNRWRFPDNGINHGNVVWAYTEMRKQKDELLEALGRVLNATALNHRNERWHSDAEYLIEKSNS